MGAVPPAVLEGVGSLVDIIVSGSLAGGCKLGGAHDRIAQLCPTRNAHTCAGLREAIPAAAGPLGGRWYIVAS